VKFDNIKNDIAFKKIFESENHKNREGKRDNNDSIKSYN